MHARGLRAFLKSNPLILDVTAAQHFAKQTPPSSHFLISPALGAGFVVLGYRLVMTTV
jgi:hypothetical protein